MLPILSGLEAKSLIQQSTDEEHPTQAESKQPLHQAQQQAFTTIHTAANTTPYPNSNQADKERVRNNTHRAKTKDSNDPNIHIKQQERDLLNSINDCIASIKSASEKNQEKKIERLEKKLASLQQQHANLRKTQGSDRVADSDSSVGPPSETSESEDSWFSSGENSPTNSPSSNEEELRPFHEALSKWEHELTLKKTDLITKTNAKAKNEELMQYQREIDALQVDIGKLKQILHIATIDTESSTDTPNIDGTSPTQSPRPYQQSSVADVIRRTRTGRRNYGTSENKVQPTSPSSTTPTPLKQLHGSPARRSALLSRDDLKPLFNIEARKMLQKIDEKIEAVAGTIDELFAKKNNIKNKKPNGDQSQKEKKLHKIDLEVKKLIVELARLNNRLILMENLVFPETEKLSDKQKHERYEEFIQKYKSNSTLKLEEDYKKKRAEYERKILNSPSTNAMSLFAGGVTNFATFFWGNSLTRLLASKLPDAASYIASYAGGALAGLLHGLFGGPVLKQVARASWNAPALTKFNDYWKVLGSLWGDRLRARLGKLGVERWAGENHKEKYLSTDPKHKGLVDIEQRWSETPGLLKLFWDRYKTEEAAYYSYAMNFTFKAAAAAGLAQMMATKSCASRVIEWAFHSVMGWFSGAETVAGIQLARSKVPGATESAIPNREIHTAHAAMLESLLKNLEDAYGKLRTQPLSAASDTEQRDLLKAIRRTQKALNEAKTKSSVGDTFWFEFIAQFKTADARADAAAEVLGRTLSVMPSAVLSNFLASWRTSGNPVLTFAGHALPALLLIAPPGWTMRPIYAGFFRALFQIVINETSPKTNTSGHASTTTAMPDDFHDSIVVGSNSSRGDDSQFSELDKVVESVVVGISEGDQASDDDDSDDERWRGKATARNQQNYW